MQEFRASALSPFSADEFEELVADFLRLERGFVDFTRDQRVAGMLVDLVAYPSPTFTPPVPTYVEVKHVLVVSQDLVERELARRDEIRRKLPEAKYLFAFSGQLTTRAKRLAEQSELEVLDGPDILAARSVAFQQRWSAALERNLSLLNMAMAHAASPPPSQLDALRQGLPAIQPGRASFAVYQEWVRDVCELLFVPPLGPVHYEKPDAAKRNRRDVILQNWAADGFWSHVRHEYKGHQIVVDAKNYSGALNKDPVVEIAHYLKSHGCGLFGLLFSRKGPGGAATHAIREEWVGSQRLIIALSDADVLEMIDLKQRGDPPEEILRHRIGTFRQSL